VDQWQQINSPFLISAPRMGASKTAGDTEFSARAQAGQKAHRATLNYQAHRSASSKYQAHKSAR
ncbi:MAG: hypothetical protein ABJO59_01885, partial [Tateyamaria sp.]